MNISGTTQTFMILGDPVAQVRAPEVYNHLFERHGVNAVLVPAKVAPADLIGFVKHSFSAQNFGGFWATMPHKAAIKQLADDCDQLAKVAGAANALRRNANGKLEAALFDGIGFVKGLDFQGIACEGKRFLVIGAGGGGQAVAAALAQRNTLEVAVFNRTEGRAAALVSQLQPYFGTKVTLAKTSEPQAFDVIINCTSQGLKAGDQLPVDVARVRADAKVVDIIMSREATPLLQACKSRGIEAHAGFEMLVQQIPEYLKFFGMYDLAATLQADTREVRAILYPK
jgi:shikimate dehydrogenase